MQRKITSGRRLSIELLEDRRLLSSSGIGAFLPTTSTWSLRSTPSAGPADLGTFQFGAYVPVVGDWNGDKKDGIGTFTPASSTWKLRQTPNAGSANVGQFWYGPKNALPVVGDWNGDGKDSIGTVDPKTATWRLRNSTNAGTPNAGTFVFGPKYAVPVAGDFNAPAPAANVITNFTFKPLDLNLLGLEIQTSPITVTVSSTAGDGKLIGNMLNSGANLINTMQVNAAVNNVFSTTADLVNSSS